MKCPNCEGYGYTIETEPDLNCCGWFLDSGSCCNNPTIVPKPIQVPCEMCQTTGKIE